MARTVPTIEVSASGEASLSTLTARVNPRSEAPAVVARLVMAAAAGRPIVLLPVNPFVPLATHEREICVIGGQARAGALLLDTPTVDGLRDLLASIEAEEILIGWEGGVELEALRSIASPPWWKFSSSSRRCTGEAVLRYSSGHGSVEVEGPTSAVTRIAEVVRAISNSQGEV